MAGDISPSSTLEISGGLFFGAALSANLILFGAAWRRMTICWPRDDDYEIQQRGEKDEVEWC